MCLFLEDPNGISARDLDGFLDRLLARLDPRPRRVLLIPPDITRLNSYAGILTGRLYRRLEEGGSHCDILPALGTHMPMTRAQQIAFFGPDLPPERFIVHDWRHDTVTLGVLPADEVAALSDGLLRRDVPVEVNRALVEGEYDLLLSIGQVVPHEVAGMANYTKNILVGCGGSGMINLSHLLGVLYGTERTMGRDHTPVRRLFDRAQERFLSALPLRYLLTVTDTDDAGHTSLRGLYASRGREGFDRAVALALQVNVHVLDRPVQTCVVRLDPKEFRTSWLGNKSVYRTRRALAPGARLIILAPGFERFGEDERNDQLIRKYGYIGGQEILRAMETAPDLQENLSVVAHLAQGSSDGKFQIIYCTPARFAADVRSVGYAWEDVERAQERYAQLRPGWNTLAGEEVYYIPNPALGLWVSPTGAAD